MFFVHHLLIEVSYKCNCIEIGGFQSSLGIFFQSSLGILSISRKAQIYVQKHVYVPTNGFEIKGCLRNLDLKVAGQKERIVDGKHHLWKGGELLVLGSV